MPESLRFRTSSYSGGGGQNCVEVADVPGGSAAVRDSQNPGAGHFVLSSSEWSAFLDAVRCHQL